MADPIQFIKTVKPTFILTIILAPYFYVLWIWRHNNTEEKKEYDRMDALKRHLAEIQDCTFSKPTAATESLKHFLENKIDQEPKANIYFDLTLQAIFDRWQILLENDKSNTKPISSVQYYDYSIKFINNIQKLCKIKTGEYSVLKTNLNIFNFGSNDDIINAHYNVNDLHDWGIVLDGQVSYENCEFIITNSPDNSIDEITQRIEQLLKDRSYHDKITKCKIKVMIFQLKINGKDINNKNSEYANVILHLFKNIKEFVVSCNE